MNLSITKDSQIDFMMRNIARILESLVCSEIDVFRDKKPRTEQTPLLPPPPPPNVHGTFLKTKSICESSLN